MKKRITALLLVLVMLLGTLPTVALAADNSVCVVKNAATSAITDGIVLDDDKSEPVYFQLLGMDEGAAPIAFQDGNFQTFAKFEDPYVNQMIRMNRRTQSRSRRKNSRRFVKPFAGKG